MQRVGALVGREVVRLAVEVEAGAGDAVAEAADGGAEIAAVGDVGRRVGVTEHDADRSTVGVRDLEATHGGAGRHAPRAAGPRPAARRTWVRRGSRTRGSFVVTGGRRGRVAGCASHVHGAPVRPASRQPRVGSDHWELEGREAMTQVETNWAGNHTYRARIERVQSIEQLQEVVAAAPRVRALGSRHSFTDLTDTTDGTAPAACSSRSPTCRRRWRSTPAARTARVTGRAAYGDVATRLQAEGWALGNLASLPAHLRRGCGRDRHARLRRRERLSRNGGRRTRDRRTRRRAPPCRPAATPTSRAASWRSGRSASSPRSPSTSSRPTTCARTSSPDWAGRPSRPQVDAITEQRLQRQPLHPLDRRRHRPGVAQGPGRRAIGDAAARALRRPGRDLDAAHARGRGDSRR